MRKSHRVDTIMRRDRDDDSNQSACSNAFNKKRKGNPIAVPIAIPGQYNTPRIAGMHTSGQSSSGLTNRAKSTRPSATTLHYSTSTSSVRDQSSSSFDTIKQSSKSSITQEPVKRRRLRQRDSTPSPTVDSSSTRQASKEVIEIDDSEDEDIKRNEDKTDEKMRIKEPTVVIPIEDYSSSLKASRLLFPIFEPPTTAESNSSRLRAGETSTTSSSTTDKFNADVQSNTPKRRKTSSRQSASNPLTRYFPVDEGDEVSIKTDSQSQLQLSQQFNRKLEIKDSPQRSDKSDDTARNNKSTAAASIASKAMSGQALRSNGRCAHTSANISPPKPLSLVQSSSLILDNQSDQNSPSSLTAALSASATSTSVPKTIKSPIVEAETSQQSSIPEYTTNITESFLRRPKRSQKNADAVSTTIEDNSWLMLKSRNVQPTKNKNKHTGNSFIKRISQLFPSFSSAQSSASSTTSATGTMQSQTDYERYIVDQLRAETTSSSSSSSSSVPNGTRKRPRNEPTAPNKDRRIEEDNTSESSDKGYTTAPPSPYSSPTKDDDHDQPRRIVKSRKIEHDIIDDYTIEPIGADEHYLSYPFTKKKAITVFECDYERLNEENYLNDTLIDIFPKIWHDCYAPQSEDIHTFSSFFFTKLHTRYGHIDYEKVHRWTSKLDIFKKKLLILPVNQNNHWFLIVVLNPGYCIRGEKGRNYYNNASLETDSCADKDAQAASTSKKATLRKTLAAGQPLDPRKPYIITLDPLSLNKQATARAVCSYLKLEARNKLALEEKDFLEPQYVMVSCPGQKNYTDCGVFCLHYIQSLYAKTNRMMEALYVSLSQPIIPSL